MAQQQFSIKRVAKGVFISIITLILLLLGLFYGISAYETNSVKYATPVGKLYIKDNQAYAKAIVDQCDRQSVKNICIVRVLGYDDKYIYALQVEATYDNIHTENANQESATEFEARYTYTKFPLKISNFVAVGDDNANPSIEELYPKSVYKADRNVDPS